MHLPLIGSSAFYGHFLTVQTKGILISYFVCQIPVPAPYLLPCQGFVMILLRTIVKSVTRMPNLHIQYCPAGISPCRAIQFHFIFLFFGARMAAGSWPPPGCPPMCSHDCRHKASSRPPAVGTCIPAAVGACAPASGGPWLLLIPCKHLLVGTDVSHQ